MTSTGEASMTFDYARYLAAKTTVDDRALNRNVLAELRRLLPAGAPRVLEVGAGLGTMVARLLDGAVLPAAASPPLDTKGELLTQPRQWLRTWADTQGRHSDLQPDGIQIGDL